MDIRKIRNVAVIGPHGVGKTTLVESMLFDMAVIPTRGRVEEGSTTTDFEGEEIVREMTLGTAMAWGDWKGTTIHLLDTPGHGEFLSEARYALAVADAALLVLDAAKGVDANVRKLYQLAKKMGLPVMIFLNKVETTGARDYAELLGQIREQLDPHEVPLELPIGRGAGFKGDYDLVGMHTWYFAPDSGEVTEVTETPSEIVGEVQRYHTELVEAIAEQHDELLERYLEGHEPSGSELLSNLKNDLLEGKLVPVLCGSAQANVAVRPLLDMIIALLPDPSERHYPELVDSETQARVPLVADPAAPVAITVLKTFSDPYLGKISVFRVLRGTLGHDSHLLNSQNGTDERLGRLFKLHGKKQVPVDQLVAGEIGAVAKLKSAQTGDTLVAAGHQSRPLRYPMPELPPSIWSAAIEPAAKQDETRLAITLGKLKEEDPTLLVGTEPRTHRTLLSGQGPTHLEVTLARLQGRYNLPITQSEPQIPYRETITGSAQGQGRHKKQSGGRGQYGDVWLRIEPLPRGAGFEFVDAVVGGAVPRNFIPAVEKGVRETLDSGLLAGFPIQDVRVTLYDGSAHSVDSSEMAFKTAAYLAMKQIFTQASPVLLEPILDVTLTVPVESLGDAMGDLNTRRGQIEGVDGNVIHARLPLSELSGLVATLQSYTKGQGSIESSFHGYQEVPSHLQPRLLTELKAESGTTG
ncbi:MAG TPA: elongation factor G [Oscillatoriaceae cyanobacterium]